MGYYLDIHCSDEDAETSTPEKVRQFLLADPDWHEEPDGSLLFGVGLGFIAAAREPLEMPQVRESRPDGPIWRELVTLRYPSGIGPVVMRECVQELLQFCKRYGFRVYDGQAECYIDENNIETVIAWLAKLCALTRAIWGPPLGEPNPPSSCSSEPQKPENVLDLLVDEFELSVRARNALKKASVRTMRDLADQTAESLMLHKNFGPTSFNEIMQLLAKFNLTLRSSGVSADDPEAEKNT